MIPDKDRIIDKIEERNELLEDLDDTADNLKSKSNNFRKVARKIEHKEEENAACFPSVQRLWIAVSPHDDLLILNFNFKTREWCRIKYQSCFPGQNSREPLEEESTAPVPPPNNDIDAMFENYKEEKAEVEKAQAEWDSKHKK